MSLPKGSNQNSDQSSVPQRNVPRRRNTRSRSRASPGRGPLHNGLMNAAWPRSPKYPHVKPSSKPYSSLNQAWVEKDNISRLTDQVEEMEVCYFVYLIFIYKAWSKWVIKVYQSRLLHLTYATTGSRLSEIARIETQWWHVSIPVACSGII